MTNDQAVDMGLELVSLPGAGSPWCSSGLVTCQRMKGQYLLSQPFRSQYLLSIYKPIRGLYLFSQPFRTQFYLFSGQTSEQGQTVFHLGCGAAVAVLASVTNPQTTIAYP